MRKRWLLIVGPFLLYWLGAVLNIIAVSVNHGMMPVALPLSWLVALSHETGLVIGPGSILDEIHIVWPATVHLAILCDIFVRRGDVFSIGDVCLWMSEFITPYCIGAWLGTEMVYLKLTERD